MTINHLKTNDPIGSQTLHTLGNADKFNYWTYRQIYPFLKGNILEIGSGIGNISKFVINNQLSFTLSDYNPEYQQFLKENFSHFPNVQAVLSVDLQHPDFCNHYSLLKEKYDSVFLLNVIEHLEDDAIAMENCRFLLKKGGHLIILAPAYSFLFCGFDKELGHYRRYSMKKLISIFPQQSFKILHTQYFNFIGIAGWFIFGKLLNRKMIGSGEMSAFNKLVPFLKLVDHIIFKKSGLSVIVIGKKN